MTIYELEEIDGQGYAVPQYQFGWPKITDPNGTVRDFIAYPGTCVPHDLHGCSEEWAPSDKVPEMGWTKDGPITYYDDILPVRIPINYHVGCMGLPPASHDFVDSIPPMVTGGNLDNTRIGVGKSSLSSPLSLAFRSCASFSCLFASPSLPVRFCYCLTQYVSFASLP